MTSENGFADHHVPLLPSFPLPEAGPRTPLMITGAPLLPGPPISIIKATKCLIIQPATGPSESRMPDSNRICQTFLTSTQLPLRGLGIAMAVALMEHNFL